MFGAVKIRLNNKKRMQGGQSSPQMEQSRPETPDHESLAIRLKGMLLPPLILLLLQPLSAVTEDVDSKCSYCLAVSKVLEDRVQNEKPRNSLDLRHRVDKEGNRYGKILDFKLSELRVFELLDGLCSELKQHQPVDVNGTIMWQHNANSQLPEMELRDRRRQLLGWCAQVIEVHEEPITDLLQSDAISGGGIQDLLCDKLTRACDPIQSSKEEL